MQTNSTEPTRPTRRGAAKFLPLTLLIFGILSISLIASPVRTEIQGTLGNLAETRVRIGDSKNENWAAKYARQFKSWRATETMDPSTAYAGSSVRDYLAEDPRMVVMWAGYAFAKDYKAPRGHYYAITDLIETDRRNDKTPATCYSCKSPDVPRVMLRDGADKFYADKFDNYTPDVKNPIGCADCHNPSNMKLQISRPALIEAKKRQGIDITKATVDEMRTLVCAQCHVEYYFKGSKEKYLTFPWDDGITIEGMEKYYEKSGHVDWTHAISGAKMIKMQHPDYEMFQQSLHGKRGVSCADCHMPETEDFAGKTFTDHQIRSPLYNVDKTCGKCHDWTSDQAKSRVTEIQDRNKEMLDRAARIITSAHFEIGDAMKLGATDAELDNVRRLVRLAQMNWDYVSAANGMGFHAPQESARVLGKAIDIAQECRIEVASIRSSKGANRPFVWPDITSKEKAQAFIKPFVAAQTPTAPKPPQR